MSHLLYRALPNAVRARPIASSLLRCSYLLPPPLSTISTITQSRRFHVPSSLPRVPLRAGGVFAAQRGFRKVRLGSSGKKQPPKRRELHLDVSIGIEEGLPDDPEIQSIAELLRLNVPMAMKIAFDGLQNLEYKTRDTSISDISKYEKVELSLLLCNDEFIWKLNQEWRDEDRPTDVLSLSNHIPDLGIPILMLGDIVISVETAVRQAEDRGHTFLDEIRILLVHGLLHLMGFDHEISIEAEEEMEKEEELILRSLGWKGKGLINSAGDFVQDDALNEDASNGTTTIDANKKGKLALLQTKV